jgi:hypothetical protein
MQIIIVNFLRHKELVLNSGQNIHTPLPVIQSLVRRWFARLRSTFALALIFELHGVFRIFSFANTIFAVFPNITFVAVLKQEVAHNPIVGSSFVKYQILFLLESSPDLIDFHWV